MLLPCDLLFFNSLGLEQFYEGFVCLLVLFSVRASIDIDCGTVVFWPCVDADVAFCKKDDAGRSGGVELVAALADLVELCFVDDLVEEFEDYVCVFKDVFGTSVEVYQKMSPHRHRHYSPCSS